MGIIIQKQEIGKKRTIERVVMFLDIRGYTRSVSENNLKTLAEITKELYEASRKILKGCEFMKFQGDEVMGVHTNCSVLVRKAFRLRTASTKILEKIGLDAGIGIHKDRVYFLDTKTKDFGTIQVGQAFNIAKRLEQASYGGDITISENVYKELTPSLKRKFTIKQELLIKGWGVSVETRVSVR